MDPTPLIAFSLRDQIVEHIRNDVLRGRLADGDRLNETELAERFGVSRTPIREALQQLTCEGLLDGRRNAGVTVARRPPDSIRELVVPIRRSVETFALKSFYDTIVAEDYVHWNVILDKMRAACLIADYPTISEQDLAFHRALVRRAGQIDLEAIWASIVFRVRHHFWETQHRNYADPIAIYDEHVAILNVFREGDLDSAVEALAKNIN
jgi:DNA-binding GntR family transcriptional regulator